MSLFRSRFLSIPSLFMRYHSHSPRPFSHEAVNAVSSFHNMLSMRPAPPITQFNNILGSLVRMNHYPTAVSLSQQLELKGIAPDIATLTILINCFCHLGRMNYAFSVLGKILKRAYQPDTTALTTLMKGLCLNGEIRSAINFHDDVKAKGFQFQVDRVSVTYRFLINELCEVGETGAALQLLRQIEEEHTDVQMYNTIIKSMCEDKCVSDAYDLYNEMLLKRISPDVFTYNTLIYGFCAGGQLRKAVGFFNVMKMENIKPDVSTFDPLIHALCKERKVKQANSVVAAMIKASVEPNVFIYNTLIDGYCLINQMTKARFLSHTMATRGVTPDVHTYNIMISWLCTSNMMDEAMSLFHYMDLKDIKPDAETYSILIEGWLNLPHYMHAINLLAEMCSNGIAYTSKLDAICNDYNFDDEIEKFMRYKETGGDADFLIASHIVLRNPSFKATGFGTYSLDW
ncbi:putative pentatricopeptide repeat-containing protein At1g12700, mitochondrial [Lotus japonicus]|uniref:putative pentatricopeptide repeat-containing protein At1g12700, mitochondrial n=1 Tax=Lotus japonicus TaxID=34305 RepID=UPI00258EA66E|nr:putative pentatricopeptide repeat-containing protein At1g12700, mitochondrial [Lotus japonicus]